MAGQRSIAAVGNPSAIYDTASFGPFLLTPSERLLVKGGEPVAVGGRALDILVALVDRAGQVVSRRELIERVWPDVIVEEANLRVHLAGLRKVLGDGKEGARYITNVPGRGYCFVAPIRRSKAAGRDIRAAVPTGPVNIAKLPAPLARMIGRQEAVAGLRSQLSAQRFVNIVAPGGMGKTTVAVAVANAMLSDFDDEVCFVDLGVLAEGALVVSAVALAVGCLMQAQDPLPGLLAFLADKRMLLVLDNCEHVIEAVAALAERVFTGTAQVHLLTTSRESLRVEGEHIYKLLPLESPWDDGELSAAQALTSPAVQLFMERAAAGGYRLELGDAEAPTVADICRRLDGIALAIELAASRVGTYGIRGTADLLGNRFKLLWQGRRTALPRHQTLQSMLDWSYNLLLPNEQTILSRLSIFAGHFTLQGALAIGSETDADALYVAEAVASLVDKSLIWNSEIGGSLYYRLLETTRAYAAAKLEKSGQQEAVAKRHASYYVEYLKSASTGSTATDMTAFEPHIGNIRAALEWSLSTTGDTAIGVRLAAQSASLFLARSLLAECDRWCARALATLPEDDQGTEIELALQQAVAISSMFTRGNSPEVRSAIERGLQLAEALAARQHQLQLLAGLNIFLTRIGDFRGALAVAERIIIVAGGTDDQAGIVMAEWMLGVSHHLVGDQAAAQRHCERGFELAAARNLLQVDFFGYDHRVRALVALARALWLRGLSERALEVARQVIDEAMDREHPIDFCIAFIYAVPVFIWAGDFNEADALIGRLVAHAVKNSLGPYHAVGLALKGELAVVRGDAVTGIQLLRRALATLQAERHYILAAGFSRALAEALAGIGHHDEAAATIARAMELAEQSEESFDLPDLLRAQAEILMAGPHRDVAAAEALLVRSLECAAKQSALAWQLRAADSLARLWVEQGRAEDARELLTSLQQQLPTTDLNKSRQLTDVMALFTPLQR